MLEIKNVTYTAFSHKILNDLSFLFSPGKLYGLIGPNGSGKSTLLKNIAHIWKPSNGMILWKEQVLQTWSRQKISQHIHLVPQETNNCFSFTVEEIVSMGQYSLKEKNRECIEWALQIMGLEDIKSHSIHKISGGQRKRAFIARSLASQAPILLYDEPTTSLDIQHVQVIWQLLQKMKKNKTIIVATHALQEAAQCCDNLLVLKEGSLRVSGSPRASLHSDILQDVFNIHSANLAQP